MFDRRDGRAAARQGRGVGEQGLRRCRHGRVRPVDDGGRGVVRVRGDLARRVDHQRIGVAQVDVDDRRGVDIGENRVDAADVGQQWVAQLAEDPDVDVAGRAGRSDERRVLALEDGGVAGDAAFDGFLEHDVGLVEARLGPAGRVVVDLDGHGRALRHRAHREPPARSRGTSASGRRSWWSSAVGPSPPRRGGSGRRSRHSTPTRRGRRWPGLPRRTVGAPGSESRRICPCLRVDRRGAAPESGVIHA